MEIKDILRKHTKGTWELYTQLGNVSAIVARAVPGGYVCSGPGGSLEAVKQFNANAQHIVDCVNACEGINSKAVPRLLEALKDAIKILESVKQSRHFDKAHIYQAIAEAEE